MTPGEDEWVCRNCDHTKEIDSDNPNVITSKREEKNTVVVEEEFSTLPKTNARCPECDNTEAYWRLQQTRAADEPETRIYRCTACRHTWREY